MDTILGATSLSRMFTYLTAFVGAFLAGYLLSPIFKVGTINDAITVSTMLVTLLGSVILLAALNLFRRRGWGWAR